jgi:hypothetical protein
MSDLIYLLAVLACPIGMGVMMLLMMRGNHGHKVEPSSDDEVARLRAEVEQFRAERSADPRSTDAPSAR